MQLSQWNTGLTVIRPNPISQEIRASDAIAPCAPLVTGCGANSVSSVRPDLPLPSWQRTIIPRWDTASDADMESRRRLRSGSTSSLMVPPSRRATLGERAFPVAAARAWNSLPTCQISVIISDSPAQSEVTAVQCVFSRRLNIGLTVLLLLLITDVWPMPYLRQRLGCNILVL